LAAPARQASRWRPVHGLVAMAGREGGDPVNSGVHEPRIWMHFLVLPQRPEMLRIIPSRRVWQPTLSAWAATLVVAGCASSPAPAPQPPAPLAGLPGGPHATAPGVPATAAAIQQAQKDAQKEALAAV